MSVGVLQVMQRSGESQPVPDQATVKRIVEVVGLCYGCSQRSLRACRPAIGVFVRGQERRGLDAGHKSDVCLEWKHRAIHRQRVVAQLCKIRQILLAEELLGQHYAIEYDASAKRDATN